jgi:manganese transport protein
MPHNLYLHSALVQTREVDQTESGKRQACRYNLVDTAVALNAAFFVNASILIVAASVFFTNGVVVTEIQQAHELLTPLLGTTIASTLFAVALICAGQSSTLTGTLAGQIVMEGFLQFKIRPVLRRLITRLIAIIPAVMVIGIKGDHGSYDLLILSQVILSLQLPFAVVPLIKFTSSKERMGTFVNKLWVKILAWVTAAIIIALNANLVIHKVTEWLQDAGPNAIWLWLTVVPVVVGCGLLLLYISLPERWRRKRRAPRIIPARLDIVSQQYNKVGVALDYGAKDEKVLSHAQTLAQYHNAEVFLFHVVEGVSGQLYGTMADDDEARQDKEHLDRVAEQLRAVGLRVNPLLGFGRVPDQLIKLSEETGINILVMGAHGHRGLKDIFFGASISKVRHALAIPVLVVQ